MNEKDYTTTVEKLVTLKNVHLACIDKQNETAAFTSKMMLVAAYATVSHLLNADDKQRFESIVRVL